MNDGFRLQNLLISLGILVGALGLTWLAISMRAEPPRTPPPDRIPVVTTTAAEAWTAPLAVSAAGTARPRAEIDLSPQVGGRVEYVSPNFVSGGRVQAGELLVRIEAADYQNRVAQAEAQVAQDRVALLQAEEEARIAEAEFRRFQARQGTTGQPSPLTLREPQLNAARAALARSEAQLADAALALSRTEITASFDGVVRSESADVGGLASPGVPLGRIYASDMVEVIVPLPDAEAGLLPGLWNLRAGSADRSLPARVFASFGDRRYRWDGYVDRAEAALDAQTRTVNVVVRVPRPFTSGQRVTEGVEPVAGASNESAPPLLVGQFAQVEIEGRAGNYFRVPRRALGPGNQLWIADGDVVRIVQVEVVQRRDDDLFVVGDLSQGDQVITSGITLATEGMQIRVGSEG